MSEQTDIHQRLPSGSRPSLKRENECLCGPRSSFSLCSEREGLNKKVVEEPER